MSLRERSRELERTGDARDVRLVHQRFGKVERGELLGQLHVNVLAQVLTGVVDCLGV